MKLQKEFIDTKNYIENLSNGIFYNIFDYLDGYDIYQAFSNLNIRFENLLINPLFIMKIQFSSISEFDDHYKQFINSNKRHIISLYFNNESILGTIIKSGIITSFEHLESIVLNPGCAHNQLINLLLYIPQLSHLSCDYLIKSNNDIKSEMVMKLNDLKHLTVVIDEIDFIEFEEFLLKLCSQLQFLNVKIHSSDKTYLNANQWEQLISQKMISLNKFFFSYTDTIHGNFNVTSHVLLDGFTSSFWIDRKWMFKLLTHDDELTYSIRSYS